MEEVVCNREVAEVDERPGHAGGAAEDGEDEEPGDEEDEDVGGPDPRVHEPLGVLVQIRRGHRLHVELRHRSPRPTGARMLRGGGSSRPTRRPGSRGVGRHRGVKGWRKVTIWGPSRSGS